MLAKYGPLVSLLVGAIASAVSPSIQSFWAAHSGAAAIAIFAAPLVALFAPQPHK